MMMKAKNITSLYYSKNRDRLLAYQKKYYQENIEAHRNRARAYYLSGKFDCDKHREYMRNYRENNIEKMRKYNREYMRKYRANEKSKISK